MLVGPVKAVLFYTMEGHREKAKELLDRAVPEVQV